jgi:cystathionine gamma-synthase
MTLSNIAPPTVDPDTTLALRGHSTRAVHAGANRKKPFHALIEPIVQTATYAFDDLADIQDFIDAKENGGSTHNDYGRYGNPTVQAVESRIAALENAESALLLSSGMAAITTTLLALLQAGDHIIITDDCYKRTREFVENFFARYDVSSTIVPMGNIKAIENAITPETRILISETPTNPYLRVADIDQLVQLAKTHNLLTLLDTTFATPINLRPADYGVDLIVHSGSKYLGGHHDLLAGAVIGSKNLIDQIREQLGMLGGIISPQNAFLLGRGLKTLALRVRHQNRTTQQVAEYLENHPKIEQVWYPGLASHPDHEIAARQMEGFGGVVSFTYKGSLNDTAAFIDRLQLPYITPSLGGTESLINQPALMSYYTLTTAERESIGISDSLVRFALGVEDAEDIIADLAQALQR